MIRPLLLVVAIIAIDASTKSQIAAATYPPPPPVSREVLRSEVDEAKALLAEAPEFADNAPHEATGAPDWYERDRRFQANDDKVTKQVILRLARTQGHQSEWDGVAYDVTSNLGQSESFLFAAVQSAVALCNGADARSNLRVARADIKEADRDLTRSIRDSDNWSPPEIDSSDDTDKCDH